MLLQLKPGFRRVWREAGTVQIGLSRRRGTVLGGITEHDAALLDQLRDGVDAQIFEAAHDGLDAARGRELVRLLAEAGVLVGRGVGVAARDRLGPTADRLAPDAAVWSLVHPQTGDGWSLIAARADRRVSILGAGRLGSTLASTLATAGIGHVEVSDPLRVAAGDVTPAGAAPAEVGRPREEAAVAQRPDLVVLIEHGAADASAAEELVSTDVPHLSIVIREDDVVVGPLVRPGAGPCLRCLDLHRSDRDPAWTSILAQLLTPSAQGFQPEETAICSLAAGLGALQVLAHLDGVSEPAAHSATLEIELPDGLIARRGWPSHPRCGCHWPPTPQPSP